MKYQLIILNNQPILVSDEEIKGNEWYLWNNSPVKNHIVPTTDGDMWSNDFHKSKLKIIAGIPELPSIDFSALSPKEHATIEYVDVVNLAIKNGCDIRDISGYSFIKGFKTAQSLNEKKFSEEEARLIWKAGQEYWKTSGESVTFEELIERRQQLLSKPKVFHVKVKMEEVVNMNYKPSFGNGDDSHYNPTYIKQPEITNNSIKITNIL